MNLDNEHFVELTLGYIQQKLSTEEKYQVYQLILENPEFMQILKNELTLKARLEALTQPIPKSLKSRVYNNITCQQQEVGFRMLGIVLERTLPTIVRPAIKLFQRSVLAYE